MAKTRIKFVKIFVNQNKAVTEEEENIEKQRDFQFLSW